MKKKERIFGLDVVRSLAILLVLITHSYDGWNYLFPSERWWYFYTGVIGVELFFVLSGFLIGGILIRILSESNLCFNDILQFLKRRWYRTIPNYFLFVAINIVLGFVILYQAVNPQDIMEE